MTGLPIQLPHPLTFNANRNLFSFEVTLNRSLANLPPSDRPDAKADRKPTCLVTESFFGCISQRDKQGIGREYQECLQFFPWNKEILQNGFIRYFSQIRVCACMALKDIPYLTSPSDETIPSTGSAHMHPRFSIYDEIGLQ